MTTPDTPPVAGPDPSNTPVETLLVPLDPDDTAVTELADEPAEAEGDEDPDDGVPNP